MAAPSHPANDLFRAARTRRGMSRQRLADEVNALAPGNPGHFMTSTAVARIEQGVVRWPSAPRRRALRRVLGAASDADHGLFDRRRR